MLAKSTNKNLETEKDFILTLMPISILEGGRKTIFMDKEFIYFLTAKFLMDC